MLKEYDIRDAPTLGRFMNSVSREQYLIGPIGSGKSTAALVKIGKLASEQSVDGVGVRCSRWVVVRNTYRQLTDTTLASWMQWYGESGLSRRYIKSENKYVFDYADMQSEVLFRALDKPDDVSNLLSLELTGGWLNEFRYFPFRMLRDFKGRLGRYPKTERNLDGSIRFGPSWSGLLADTNPPDVDSDWYRYLELERPASGVEVFRQPSGLSDVAENKRFLRDNYYEDLCVGASAEWVKVYVHGEYGFSREGKGVYHEFDEGRHVVDADLGVERGSRLIVGMDWGLTPSAVFGQFTVGGQWRVFRELVTEDTGAEEFARMVRGVLDVEFGGHLAVFVGDPAGNQRSQTDTRTVFDVFRKYGMHVKAGPVSIAARLEGVRAPLLRSVGREPGFVLSRTGCPMLLRGFMGGYQYRRKNVSGDVYVDVPDKNQYSHVHDALQYMCSLTEYSRLRRSEAIQDRPVIMADADYDEYSL
jgi:hypothetical protein